MTVFEANRKKLQTAFIRHQKGDLVEAAQLYSEILRDDEFHFDALHLSGLLAGQMNDFARAHDFFDKAIQMNREFSPLYLNRANAFHTQGRFADALVNYDLAIAFKPDYADAYNNRGNTLASLKRYVDALASNALSLVLKPDYVHARNNRGALLSAINRLSEAINSYEKALSIQPDSKDSYNNLGVALQSLGRHQDAILNYAKAIEIDPHNAHIYNNRGISLHALGRFADALISYEIAIELKHDYADAFSNAGDTYRALNQADHALISYDRALAIRPAFAQAYNNRGVALQECGRLLDARASYEKAVISDLDYAEAWLNHGFVCNELKLFHEALDHYRHAIILRPAYLEAYYNLGNTLKALKLFDAALVSYGKALLLDGDFADAHYNGGLTLMEMKQFERALTSIEKTLEIKPDYIDACNSRASLLAELKRFDEALACFDHALVIRPDYAPVYSNRGVMFFEMGRFEEAIADYASALSLKPDLEFTDGALFSTRMKICDWSRYDQTLKTIVTSLNSRQRAFHPFHVLGAIDDCGLQKQAAEIWCESRNLSSIITLVRPKYGKDRKIRIGYFSPDFRNHPVSYLTARMLELHDREKFDVIGFYYGTIATDEMHGRVRKAFDRFYDVRSLSGFKIAELARECEIDIAVDLCGYTLDCRPEIFAHRAAPVQISYLGFPGTMGVNFIDYIIADHVLIPPEKTASYSEKVIYLPCFQVNDSQRVIGSEEVVRAELGLPQNAFVFCCFNNTYKFNPAILDLWARILGAVDKAVLWMFADTPAARTNISREFRNRGLSDDRLFFVEKAPRTEYLARYRLADLFLDTLPYNGGTTASDALWAGLPVLTLQGESFAGRMAASLLSALDLPELIAGSPEDYVRIGIDLAMDAQKISNLKSRLAANIRTSIVFDSLKSTRLVEAGYRAAYERHHADSPPDHIFIHA